MAHAWGMQPSADFAPAITQKAWACHSALRARKQAPSGLAHRPLRRYKYEQRAFPRNQQCLFHGFVRLHKDAATLTKALHWWLPPARKNVGWGKRVTICIDLGGRRLM